MKTIGDILIETEVDRLIALVAKRKKISIAEAAKILGEEEKNVEEWVHALEENGYLKVSYPLVSSPIIEIGDLKISASEGAKDGIFEDVSEARVEKLESEISELKEKTKEMPEHKKQASENHLKILFSLLGFHKRARIKSKRRKLKAFKKRKRKIVHKKPMQKKRKKFHRAKRRRR